MKRVVFTLSMPNVGSWNGKWTGEGRNYTITRTLKDDKATEIVTKSPFYYSFGDGWCASIAIRILSVGEIVKKSNGFYGYDWMVDSIERAGKIVKSSLHA